MKLFITADSDTKRFSPLNLLLDLEAAKTAVTMS